MVVGAGTVPSVGFVRGGSVASVGLAPALPLLALLSLHADASRASATRTAGIACRLTTEVMHISHFHAWQGANKCSIHWWHGVDEPAGSVG